MSRKIEVANSFTMLKGFISNSQLKAIETGCRGEEKEFFFDKVVEMAKVVSGMPKTYEQDGLGDKAIVSLHYFSGNSDYFITEKDMGTPDEPGQHQAFGLTDIGCGSELGYISIVELLKNGVELDLYWTPKTIGEIKTKKEVA